MDGETFGHDFPVWYLVAADAPGGPVWCATVRIDGDRCLPVFTDEALADAFRPPGAGPYFPVPVRSPAAQADLLRRELAGVVSHVACDSPP